MKLSENLLPEQQVCLAGIILEYSATCLPCSEDGSSHQLDRVRLHLYECAISKAQERHVLVQFSIPEAIAGEASLQPEAVKDGLRRTFEPRVAEFAAAWKLDLSCTTVTKDRIVF